MRYKIYHLEIFGNVLPNDGEYFILLMQAFKKMYRATANAFGLRTFQQIFGKQHSAEMSICQVTLMDYFQSLVCRVEK